MPSFTTEISIDAPVDTVWEVLADIGEIHRWNPGVVASNVTTEATGGLGAGRHCDLGGKNYLDERVAEWEEKEAISFRIIGTNMPLKTATVRFTLEGSNGQTVVAVSPSYELKFGPLGTLMDALFVRRAYRQGMAALLAGLKEDVENGR